MVLNLCVSTNACQSQQFCQDIGAIFRVEGRDTGGHRSPGEYTSDIRWAQASPGQEASRFRTALEICFFRWDSIINNNKKTLI